MFNFVRSGDPPKIPNALTCGWMAIDRPQAPGRARSRTFAMCMRCVASL